MNRNSFTNNSKTLENLISLLEKQETNFTVHQNITSENNEINGKSNAVNFANYESYRSDRKEEKEKQIDNPKEKQLVNNGLIQRLKNWPHSIRAFSMEDNVLKIAIDATTIIEGEVLLAVEKLLAQKLAISKVSIYPNFDEKSRLSKDFLAKLLPWAAEVLIDHEFAIFSILLSDLSCSSEDKYLDIKVSTEKRGVFSQKNRRLIEKFYETRLGIECEVTINTNKSENNSSEEFNKTREAKFFSIAKELSARRHEEELLNEENVVRRVNDTGEPVAEIITSNDSGRKRKKANNKHKKDNKTGNTQDEKFKYRNSANRVYGRLDNRLELTEIIKLDSESGRVSVYGKVAFYESKLVSNGTRVLIKFAIHGKEGAITCLLFMNEVEEELSFHERIKDGVYVRADLDVTYDGKFSKDLQGFVRGIELADPPEERQDNAPVKRVELHLHTNFSERDGIIRTKEAIKLADKFGMPAVAITDHGVVQAYPEAYQQVKELRDKGSNLKLIYGCENYIIDDGEAVVYGFRDLEINDRFVDIKLKTTGPIVDKDRVLQVMALEFIKDSDSGHYLPGKSFSSIFNPEIEIDEEKLLALDISIEEINNAPKTLEAIKLLHDFIAGSAVSSFQGLDALGFIRYESYRTENYDDARLKFNPTFIDGNDLIEKFRPEFDLESRQEEVKESFPVSAAENYLFLDNYVSGLLFDEVWGEHNYISLRELNRLCGQDSFERVIDYKNKPYHGIILVKDVLGLYNLYRLISESHVRYFKNRPRMPKSLIKYLYQGLLLGTSCENGQALRRIRQLYIDAEGNYEKTLNLLVADKVLQQKMDLYNYLEIQPLGNNLFMLDKEGNFVESIDDLINLNKLVIKLAEIVNKPVVATCDAHFLNEDDMIYREILQAASGFDPNENPTKLYVRTTNEMLDEFYYLPQELAYEIVVENTNMIAEQIEADLLPFPAGTYPPEISDAPEKLRSITWNTCKELYEKDGKIPDFIEERVNRELSSIIDNGFSVMYYISLKLVKHTNDDGYIVGSRGSVGSSFVAYLCGITEVNPLKAHYICRNCNYCEVNEDPDYDSGFDLAKKACPECGETLVGEGQNIPFETFLGFNGDKEPDIDLNFSGEYQPYAHQFIIDMFGEDFTYRAGTITSYAEKNALGLVKNYAELKDIFITKAEGQRLAMGLNGIKRSTGQHPGGIVVIPKDREVFDFTPIQYPANKLDAAMTTTHFDFNSMHDTILKLDILGHDDPTLLKIMGDITGVEVKNIPMPDEKVMQIFQGTEALGIPKDTLPDNCGSFGIPELGTLMARGMIKETQPSKFFDLVQLMGLSHGTDVWQNNAQDLIRDGVCTIEEVIGCRDGIMTSLIAWGLDPLEAFQIMEKVRKGKGLTPERETMMRENNVSEWYIESCKKIKYMFPKAHAAAYVMSALRIAWFKVYKPEAYYVAYFSIKADEFDYQLMTQPLEKITALRKEMRKNFHSELSDREQKMYYIIEIVEEMLLRNIKFVQTDIETADATRFKVVAKGEIMPALNSVNSISSAMAINIVEARADGNGEFKSHEDLMRRSGLGQAAIGNLLENGILDHIPESAQVTLFDMFG